LQHLVEVTAAYNVGVRQNLGRDMSKETTRNARTLSGSLSTAEMNGVGAAG
jgi:hypothetical protein